MCLPLFILLALSKGFGELPQAVSGGSLTSPVSAAKALKG